MKLPENPICTICDTTFDWYSEINYKTSTYCPNCERIVCGKCKPEDIYTCVAYATEASNTGRACKIILKEFIRTVH